MPRKPKGAPAPKAATPRPVGRPTKYEPRFCEAVIEDMGEGYSLTAFAGLIGVNRDTINAWMAQFPEFSEAVTRAKAARLRNWEDAAIKMRTNGGGPGGATITVFGLKNMGGDEWSDTTKHELTGKDGAAIKAEVSTDDAFAAFAGTLEGIARGKAQGS